MIELACDLCGERFLRWPSRIRGKHGNFCSRECHYKARSVGIVKRIVAKPYQITEEGRRAWQEAAKRRIGKPRKPPVTFTCETCGKEVIMLRGEICPTRKLRFCSNDCANKAICGAGNPSWRGGHKDYYGPNWREQRRKARKRDNYTCQRCGKTTKELNRSLDVHHIIPFNEFESPEEANKLVNLMSLCHPCHQHVEWNGIDIHTGIGQLR